MNQRLKIAVIGAGVFGGYHANKCAAHPRVDFIGVYDPDIERAKTQALKHGVQAFDDFQAMLSQTGAVVIASPADTHGEMALAALESGKHCLIEKPVAATLKDAARIVELAKENSLTVQVGHQERFVAKAIGLDKLSERPSKIVSRRMSKYSERGTDTLIASRLEDDFSRTMDITYPSGTVSIDFNAKTLTHDTPFELNEKFGDDPVAKDSLGAASNAFIEAVLDGKAVPITAEDGYNALKLASSSATRWVSGAFHLSKSPAAFARKRHH